MNEIDEAYMKMDDEEEGMKYMKKEDEYFRDLMESVEDEG